MTQIRTFPARATRSSCTLATPFLNVEMAPIRSLQSVQVSPSYSLRFGPHVIANGAMSGPWPQTNKQTDAPSSNSYLDKRILLATRRKLIYNVCHDAVGRVYCVMSSKLKVLICNVYRLWIIRVTLYLFGSA